MKLTKLNSQAEVLAALNTIRVADEVKGRLLLKSQHVNLYIEGITAAAAIVLKQIALSEGADVAIPMNVIEGYKGEVTVLLMANWREIERMLPRMREQPFKSLHRLADELQAELTQLREAGSFDTST